VPEIIHGTDRRPLETGKTLAHAIEAFSPKAIERYLYTSGLPEPTC